MKQIRNNQNSASRKRVEKYVKELLALEAKCRLSHSRDWPVPYLERVYALHTNWKKKKLGKQRRADIIRFVLQKRSIRNDRKLLHVIFQCTSTANSKTRNRWAGALLFARENKIEPKKIPNFLLEKNKGGIAGRAAEYAALRKARKKGKSRKSGKPTKALTPYKTSPKGTGSNAISASRAANYNDNDSWN
jgi:hypothetical protein